MALDLKDVARKTKRRKYYPADYRCDMSRGWGTDFTGAPMILSCPNRPVRFIPEFSMFGVYLCDECFEYEMERRAKES